MKITMGHLGVKTGLALCMLFVMLAAGCCVFGGGDRSSGGAPHGRNGKSNK